MDEILICDCCGKRLVRDEVALNKKLNGLDVEELLCLGCLAEALGVTEGELELKIEDFKDSGCTLFQE